MDKNDKRYQGFKVSPGAQLYIEDLKQQIKELKETFIEYFNTEGCSCCEDTEGHKKAEDKLAKLFNVPRYKDNSGNDWKQALK